MLSTAEKENRQPLNRLSMLFHSLFTTFSHFIVWITQNLPKVTCATGTSNHTKEYTQMHVPTTAPSTLIDSDGNCPPAAHEVLLPRRRRPATCSQTKDNKKLGVKIASISFISFFISFYNISVCSPSFQRPRLRSVNCRGFVHPHERRLVTSSSLSHPVPLFFACLVSSFSLFIIADSQLLRQPQEPLQISPR
ncbi:hypothetical protein J3F83DRAFT_472722 [Trichoderma novae-zelandiae]